LPEQSNPKNTSEITSKILLANADPPAKRKRSDEAVFHDKAVTAVVDYFVSISKLQIRKGDIFGRWRNPARELLEMLDWDVDKVNQLVLRTFKKMREDGLTYNSLESIMKVASYLLAQDVAPARTGIKEW
jgi:hypothetical protein